MCDDLFGKPDIPEAPAPPPPPPPPIPVPDFSDKQKAPAPSTKDRRRTSRDRGINSLIIPRSINVPGSGSGLNIPT